MKVNAFRLATDQRLSMGSGVSGPRGQDVLELAVLVCPTHRDTVTTLSKLRLPLSWSKLYFYNIALRLSWLFSSQMIFFHHK